MKKWACMDWLPSVVKSYANRLKNKSVRITSTSHVQSANFHVRWEYK